MDLFCLNLNSVKHKLCDLGKFFDLSELPAPSGDKMPTP